ncbi:MAG: hypothetical protein ACLQLH_11980 [Terracidiphilus sp.]
MTPAILILIAPSSLLLCGLADAIVLIDSRAGSAHWTDPAVVHTFSGGVSFPAWSAS